MNQGKRRGGRSLEGLEVGDQGSYALDGVLSQIQQPLPTHVRVAGRRNRSERHQHQRRPPQVDAGLTTRPVHQPDKNEGRRARQRCTGGAYGGDLELNRPRPAADSKAGEGRGAQAALLAQELRGDDEVAELFEEALILSAAKA